MHSCNTKIFHACTKSLTFLIHLYQSRERDYHRAFCQTRITHNGTTFSLPTITTECPHSHYCHTSNYSKLYSMSKAHHRTLLHPSAGHFVRNAVTLALPGTCGYEIGYKITRPTRIVGVGEWPEAGAYKTGKSLVWKTRRPSRRWSN